MSCSSASRITDGSTANLNEIDMSGANVPIELVQGCSQKLNLVSRSIKYQRADLRISPFCLCENRLLLKKPTLELSVCIVECATVQAL